MALLDNIFPFQLQLEEGSYRAFPWRIAMSLYQLSQQPRVKESLFVFVSVNYKFDDSVLSFPSRKGVVKKRNYLYMFLVELLQFSLRRACSVVPVSWQSKPASLNRIDLDSAERVLFQHSGHGLVCVPTATELFAISSS